MKNKVKKSLNLLIFYLTLTLLFSLTIQNNKIETQASNIQYTNELPPWISSTFYPFS